MGSARTILVSFGALAALAFVGQSDGFKRERNGPEAAKKDALEGKPPPSFAITEWLNTGGKALGWKALKGKVVVLDYWAHW